MKATGIIRRIDDLGRVVIPKEIRRTLRIHEGDPLELFVDKEGGIIIKKYSPIEGIPAETIMAAMKKLHISGVVLDTDNDITAGRRTTVQLPEDFDVRTLPWCGTRINDNWYTIPIILDDDIAGAVVFYDNTGGNIVAIQGVIAATIATMEV